MAKKVSLNEIQKELRDGFIRIDEKFEDLTESLNKKPDWEEFPQLLDKIFEYTTLKIEHEHIKKVIKEKLGIEV